MLDGFSKVLQEHMSILLLLYGLSGVEINRALERCRRCHASKFCASLRSGPRVDEDLTAFDQGPKGPLHTLETSSSTHTGHVVETVEVWWEENGIADFTSLLSQAARTTTLWPGPRYRHFTRPQIK